LGFKSVLDQFSSLLNEGERYDLLKAAHLPKLGRTKAQVRLGITESSQLEHTTP
jgi:hypothetical protein